MLLHLKRRALDDSCNQGREPEVMVLRVLNDLADRGHIVILEAASKRVSQHFLRHDADENLPLADERLAQANDAVEGGAVEQRSRWIDPSAFVVRSPMANGVEVFQSEPDRVHRFVAARADGVLAMLLHAFPQRERLSAFRIFLQRRNVRWRRRWRYAQQVRQNPLSTFDWRCPVWIRRDRQNAGLPKQSATCFAWNRDTTELTSVDVGHAVMARQSFVDKSVVRFQEVDDASVFAHDAVEEERGLFLHGAAKVVVEIGEGFEVRLGVLEVS